MEEEKTRSFVEIAKGGLYQQLLASADQKFDLIDQAFIPPKELIAHWKGGKHCETPEEAQRVQGLFDNWLHNALRVLRGQVTEENLHKFFDALPEPFRDGVVEALRKKIGMETGL